MPVFTRDRRNLSLQIRDQIRALMAEKFLRPGDQLPSEEALVQRYAVSRATIREALKLLEEEKSIYCRHGLGRFVAVDRHNLLSEDITRLESVTELSTRLGIQIATEVLSFTRQPAGDLSASRLGISPSEDVLILERVRSTASEAVIYSIDLFPALLAPDGTDLSEYDGSLVERMESDWGLRLAYARTTISAQTLDTGLCTRLRTNGALAWIVMEQINCDYNNRPVLYSRDYYRGDKFLFHALRRRG